MTQPFRFAHISDIHLPTFGADCTPPTAFLNKRFFSMLSWFGKRRHIHQKAVTDHLVRDCLASTPDHILVTGDLINLSLAGEYERAFAWLQSLGTPQTVSAIPGNHDLLLDTPAAQKGLALYAPYMGKGEKNNQIFPYVKRRKDVAFIGLSTAIETPLGWCSGRLGEAQREQLRTILDEAQRDKLCRIIALHHPPAGKQKPHGGLEDQPEFAAIIAEYGAELILHGHTHQSSMHALPGPNGPVPVMGVASLSVRPGKGYPVGCWHEYTLERVEDHWQILLNIHRYTGPDTPPARVAQAILNSA
ncbi:MAG: metallophosphoesterase [Robiginitomaculum sp.]|nr:metallophosphoesterase [Robiginitomaculum sp.]MDQ7077452.1 metallophosphoesterase [Robiginitomaculum sp.]